MIYPKIILLICSRIEAICAYTEILFCEKTGDYLFLSS